MLSDHELEIIELKRILAICLGAFQAIDMCPDNFNRDGVKNMIQDIEKVLNVNEAAK